MKVLNVPNILSILRILLVPGYMVFMYLKWSYANQIAWLFFVVAAFTDMLDGHIARKYGQITNIGKVIDPVADKIMVTAAMIVLVELGKLEAWIVVLMLFRDFAVGALRDLSASQGTIIAAGIWGKLKTVLQMVAIGFMVFYDTVVIYPLSSIGVIPYGGVLPEGALYIPCFTIGYVLIYIALIASVYSGIVYFMQYSKVLRESNK